MRSFNYCEFQRGSCKCSIIESDITESRAEELADEIKTFNEDNASGLYYRCIVENQSRKPERKKNENTRS
jgi:hypothetical protein